MPPPTSSKPWARYASPEALMRALSLSEATGGGKRDRVVVDLRSDDEEEETTTTTTDAPGRRGADMNDDALERLRELASNLDDMGKRARTPAEKRLAKKASVVVRLEIENVERSPPYRVAFLGNTGVGKSFLLNHLLWISETPTYGVGGGGGLVEDDFSADDASSVSNFPKGVVVVGPGRLFDDRGNFLDEKAVKEEVDYAKYLREWNQKFNPKEPSSLETWGSVATHHAGYSGFILQSASFNSHSSTTTHATRIVYGDEWGLDVSFFDRREVEKTLSEYPFALARRLKMNQHDESVHKHMRSVLRAACDGTPASREELDEEDDYRSEDIEEFIPEYRKVLEYDARKDDLESFFPKKGERVAFSKEFLRVEGRTFAFRGKGKKSLDDRAFLKRILHNVVFEDGLSSGLTSVWKQTTGKATGRNRFLIKDVVLRAPSELLRNGNCEWVDVPGSNDADSSKAFNMRKALSECDAVFMLSDKILQNNLSLRTEFVDYVVPRLIESNSRRRIEINAFDVASRESDVRSLSRVGERAKSKIESNQKFKKELLKDLEETVDRFVHDKKTWRRFRAGVSEMWEKYVYTANLFPYFTILAGTKSLTSFDAGDFPFFENEPDVRNSLRSSKFFSYGAKMTNAFLAFRRRRSIDGALISVENALSFAADEEKETSQEIFGASPSTDVYFEVLQRTVDGVVDPSVVDVLDKRGQQHLVESARLLSLKGNPGSMRSSLNDAFLNESNLGYLQVDEFFENLRSFFLRHVEKKFPESDVVAVRESIYEENPDLEYYVPFSKAKSTLGRGYDVQDNMWRLNVWSPLVEKAYESTMFEFSRDRDRSDVRSELSWWRSELRHNFENFKERLSKDFRDATSEACERIFGALETSKTESRLREFVAGGASVPKTTAADVKNFVERVARECASAKTSSVEEPTGKDFERWATVKFALKNSTKNPRYPVGVTVPPRDWNDGARRLHAYGEYEKDAFSPDEVAELKTLVAATFFAAETPKEFEHDTRGFLGTFGFELDDFLKSTDERRIYAPLLVGACVRDGVEIDVITQSEGTLVVRGPFEYEGGARRIEVDLTKRARR